MVLAIEMKKEKEPEIIELVVLCAGEGRLSQQSLKESIHSPGAVWGSGSQRSFRDPCNLVL